MEEQRGSGACNDVYVSPLAGAALAYAHKILESDTTGHDPSHIDRVFKMARWLGKAENADLEVVELTAALHDIQDFKFTGDDTSGPTAAKSWLVAQGASISTANKVAANIYGISFKGSRTKKESLTLEGMCVQDADRLDALGAVGISRCFAYGGWKQRPIHDPTVPVVEHDTVTGYINHVGTSINHFYEKLLLLKDLINTDSAKQIADERHRFMEQFLTQFYSEWHSQDASP
jgi:uncharacterized protein